MREEPLIKRTIAFVDGQNLFHAAKEAFGYSYPNYDPKKLATSVCHSKNWNLEEVYFYTGIPAITKNEKLHKFWAKKILFLKRAGIKTQTFPLSYRDKEITCPDGKKRIVEIAEEKRVDVRLALDIFRLTLEGKCDVVLIFSQDADFEELVKDVEENAKKQSRWIKVASAFPDSSKRHYRRGIEKTDWIRIDKVTYDTCIDPRQY